MSMEFTISLANEVTFDAFEDCLAVVDDLAYDTLFVGDERLNRNSYTLLALAADRTDRVDLGTAVTNPYTRHPAMTAAAIATVDDLSGGRAKLGLGGGSPIVLDPLGIEQEDPIGAVRDAVRTIRPLLAGESVGIESAQFATDGATLDVTPVSEVPIYIAGRGPSILGLAGYRGDGVLAGAGLASVEGMAYARERIADGAEKAGRSVDDLDVVCWAFLSIASDREAALDAVNPLVASIVDKTPMPALTAIGIDEADAAAVKALDDVGDRSAADLREHVPRAVTEQFAVAGTPEECRNHVERLRDAGVDHLGTLVFENEEHDPRETLEVFSDAVARPLG
ncbi:LLM class flavin-dependent oxidoreductase [Haloglomus litoreum]|uniref:LLM class flavin-dependent oxidoreductase n=1 Tax=Haloglomus litoreum TaxID=3034026 RepID=UPI0023E828C0|nr:LLM class flavin-dependent oxidoreductase [Haloglomus sp. DT116]